MTVNGTPGHMTAYRGFYPLQPSERQWLATQKIRVVEVEWALPPGLSHGAGGCSPKDLIRIQAFNLTEFDSIIYYDGDVVVVGNQLQER